MKNFLKTPRTIFIFSLSVIFVAASVAVAVLGIKIYGTATAGNYNKDLDKASEYFTEKIRSCENKDNIRTASLGGTVPALVISSETSEEDSEKETWLFVYDGYLKEVNSKKGTQISALSGKEIMPLKSLDFQILNDNLLEINMVSNEDANSVLNICMPDFGGEAGE